MRNTSSDTMNKPKPSDIVMETRPIRRSRSRSLGRGKWEINDEKMSVVSPSSISYCSDEDTSLSSKRRTNTNFEQLLDDRKFMAGDSSSSSNDSVPVFSSTRIERNYSRNHKEQFNGSQESSDAPSISIGSKNKNKTDLFVSSQTLEMTEIIVPNKTKMVFPFDDFFRAIIVFGLSFITSAKKPMLWRIIKIIGSFALCYLEAISTTSNANFEFSLAPIRLLLSRSTRCKVPDEKTRESLLIQFFRLIRKIIFSRKTILLLVYIMIWFYSCDTTQYALQMISRGLKNTADQTFSGSTSLISTDRVSLSNQNSKKKNEQSNAVILYNRADSTMESNNNIWRNSKLFQTNAEKARIITLMKPLKVAKNKIQINLKGNRDCESEFRTLLQKARDSNKKEKEVHQNEYQSKSWLDTISDMVHSFVLKVQRLFNASSQLGSNKVTMDTLYEIWMRGGIR